MTSPVAVWLERCHMTQRQLAAEMGQSRASISMKVNGDVPWQQKDLLFFNRRYGLSSDFVLGLDSSSSHDGEPRQGVLL